MISVISNICLVLLLFISVNDNVLCLDLNCSQSSDEVIDVLFAKVLTFGKNGRKFPENGYQLADYCSQEFTDLKTMSDYVKKCKTGLGKQMFQILGYTIKNHISKYCKKYSKSKEEILLAAKCWNKASYLYQICINRMVDNLLGIQNANDKKKIPLLCCQLYSIKRCFKESEEKTHICTERHSEITDQYIDSLTSNAFSLLCGDYTEDSSKCDSVGSIPKKRRDQKRTRSYFIPAIGVFEAFPEI